MDTIALRRVEVSDCEFDDEPALSVIINGLDLALILREHGCKYSLLTLTNVNWFREETVFAMQQGSSPTRLSMLQCVCGELGCGSTTVNVSRSGTSVIWSGFADDYREGAPTYELVGPFRFSTEQYDAFLAEGRRLADEYEAHLMATCEEYRNQREATDDALKTSAEELAIAAKASEAAGPTS